MASTGWKEKDDRTIAEIRHYLDAEAKQKKKE